MTYKLEHFKEFHDDPASFNEEDFRAKTLEWMIFVKETEGQYDFESEEWNDVSERFFHELDTRFARTPKLEAEYESIRERIIALPAEDFDGFVREMRLRRDFAKRYQVEFQFAFTYIARCEQELKEVEDTVYELEGSRHEKREALRRLDDSLAAFYERTGTIRSATALPEVKNHKGN